MYERTVSRFVCLILGVLVLINIGLGTAAAAPKYSLPQASEIVCGRLNDLKNAIPKAQRSRITIAVGMTYEGKIIISTSENDRSKIRPELARLLRVGEEFITNPYPGNPHAEEKIVRRAGTSLYVIAASWSICDLCAGQIRGVHGVPVTQCRTPSKERPRQPRADEPEAEPEPEPPPAESEDP